MQGKSVVIDNTNPTIKIRKEYVDMARECQVPVKCLWFSAQLPLAQHLNVHRSITKNMYRLPQVAFSTYHSRFQEPTLNEGFQEVVKIPFVPKFDTPKEQRVFEMFLV